MEIKQVRLIDNSMLTFSVIKSTALKLTNRTKLFHHQILICHLILFLVQPLECTSNINSIWLTKEDPSELSIIKAQSLASDQLKLKSTEKKFAERSGEWLSATKGLTLKNSQTLQAAASSLQPSIVSIDNQDTNDEDQRHQFANANRRRILTDAIPAPIFTGNDEPRSNLSATDDSASSLNHLWSANQTNAQVQFDEEHQTPKIKDKTKNDVNYSNELDNPHRDSPSSSNGANSSHTEIPASIDEYLNNDNNIIEHNHFSSAKYNTSLADKQHQLAPNHIYFLKNNQQPSSRTAISIGDSNHDNDSINKSNKWNPSPSVNRQQQQHDPFISENSPSIYNRKQQSNSIDSYSDDDRNQINQLAYTPSVSRSTLAYANLNGDDLNGPNNQFNQQTMNTGWPPNQQASLSYGFVPHTASTASLNADHHTGTVQQPYPTTPMPTSMYTNLGRATTKYHIPSDFRFTIAPGKFVQPQPLTLALAPQIVQHPPRIILNNNLHLANKQRSPQKTNQRREINGQPTRRPPNKSQVQMTTSAEKHVNRQSGSSSSPASFLRNAIPPILNYIRPTPNQGATNKVKKSLLSSLVGSNRWSDTLSQQSNRNIENTFYEGLPPASAANNPATDQQQALASLISSSLHQSGPHVNDYVYLTQPGHLKQAPLIRQTHNNNLLRPTHLINYPPLLGAGSYNSVMIQQPTVAPAPSSLNNYFYRGSPHIYSSPTRHLAARVPAQTSAGSQRQHNFIPVVAVEVTKTSPAPRPQQHDDPPDTSSEIEDYLEAKVGGLKYGQDNRKHRLSQAQSQSSDGDYGNVAAGSIMRDSSYNMDQSNPINSNQNHVTTVKSAVFGYLPHQAEAPLIQAMSLLPQLGSVANQKASPAAAYSQSGYMPSASDSYATHNYNQQIDPMAAGNVMVDNEQPSLALQLQANNFVQNDIAHPFSSSVVKTNGGVGNQHFAMGNYAQSPSSLRPEHLKPIDVYPSQQANHYQDFQQLLPVSNNAGESSNQFAYLNPLIGSHSAGSEENRNPYTSANELEPFLPPFFLAPNNPSAYQMGNNVLNQQNGAEATSESQQDTNELSNDNDNNRPLKMATNSLNNKGNKKRSSEFFANAGQLLISALPLLLTSTLGLMFASGPNSIARYTAPPTPLGSNRVHTSIPGTYINSLNSGMVSNASPTPHVFTPTPPGYNMATSTTSKPQTNKTTTSNPQTTGKNQSRQSSPTQQPSVIILTTLSPPPFFNGSDSINGSSYANSSQSLLNSKQTFLVLSEDETDQTESPLQDRSNATNGLRGNHYEVGGYEGVDFDTQYASLKRYTLQQQPSAMIQDQVVATTRQPLLFATDSMNSNTNRNRNRYQYSEPLVGGESSISNNQLTNRSLASGNSNKKNDASTKLYPVATWPPMRRRTVSLVTSNGNRTLLDSSDKYLTHMDNFPPTKASQIDYSKRTHRVANDTKVQINRKNPEEKVLLSLANQNKPDKMAKLRRKRSLADQNMDETLPKSRRVRVVKKIKRKRSQIVQSTSPNTTDAQELSNSASNSSPNQQSGAEQLSEDASKTKAAQLVTTLVANSEDSLDQLDSELNKQDLDSNSSGSDSRGELIRDQMVRKKMLLDRLASSNGFQAESDDEVTDFDYNQMNRRRSQSDEDTSIGGQLNSGGRGRLPVQGAPPPIEVTSTKIKVYSNGSDVTLEKPLFRGRRLNNNIDKIVLNEDTRKALANFGTLLLKDTLQIPINNYTTDELPKHTRRRSPKEIPRSQRMSSNRYANSDPNLRNHRFYDNQSERYDTSGGFATEHTLYRTSPPPVRISDENGDDLYPFNNSMDSRPRTVHQNHPSSGIRDHVNLIDDSDSHNLTPYLSSHESNKESSSPVSTRYHNFLASNNMSSGENEPSLNSSSGHYYGTDNLDANSRYSQSHSSAGNYSSHRRIEPLASSSSGYGHEHYGNNNHFDSYNTHYTGPNRYNSNKLNPDNRPIYPPDERNYSLAYGNSSGYYGVGGGNQPIPPPPPPASAHPNYGYELSYQQSPQSHHMQNYSHYSYLPNGYSRPDRPDRGQSYPPANYNYSPQSSQQRFSYPAQESRFISPGDVSMSGHSQDSSNFPPSGRPPPSDHHDSGSGQQFGARYPYSTNAYNQYHDQQLPHLPPATSNSDSAAPITSSLIHPTSQLPAVDRSEAKTVNEYLKRVHFSDSDRDKLMASYLTCDGLLNDNDHCLERLSCEFSDPLNIEKANKLDRAVSSILLGHILINTYIPNQFKLRLKSASLFGYTQSGKCSRYVCNKLNVKSPNVD